MTKKIKTIFLGVGILTIMTIIGYSLAINAETLQGYLKIKRPSTRTPIIQTQIPTDSYTPIIPNPRTIKSNFFKNDPVAIGIISGNQAYNMDELELVSGITSINKDVFAYKLFSAFKMLGYMTDRGYNSNGNKPHLIILNEFQQKYNFPITNYVNQQVLLKIDELLAVREAKEKPYTVQFPLYDNIGNLQQNDITKNHQAFLWYYSMQILPENIRLKTVLQYSVCLIGQCGFAFDNYSGDIFNPGNFILYDSRITDTPLNRLVSDPIWIHEYIHEYGHFIDGNVTDYDPTLGFGLVDTESFYEISYDATPAPAGSPCKYCYAKKTNTTNFDFITAYASEAISIYTTTSLCPAGTFIPAEDWAESFSTYVTDGKDFRAAANQNDKMAQKYTWLKNNIFNGIEYDTDMVQGNASGCNDQPEVATQAPGYVRCDETYVWDGEIRIL